MPAAKNRPLQKQIPSTVEKKKAVQEKRFAKLREKAVASKTPSTKLSVIQKRNPDRKLTEMQAMFVRHWAAGESIFSASARAGYGDNGSQCYKLSKDPVVRALYEREKKLFEESCQMTRKKVMDGLLEAAEMAKLQADPTAMVGAWREVGKMCGYYEPVKTKIDITVNGQVTQKIERMDNETLMKIIRGEISTDVIDMEFKEVKEIEG